MQPLDSDYLFRETNRQNMFTCDKTRVCSHLEGLSDRSNSSLLFVDRTKHLYIEASIDH